MTRRELLFGFGSVVLTVLLPGFAQRVWASVPRVAYLSGRVGPPDPSRDAIVQGLRELGYVEGKNVLFEPHYFGDRMERIPTAVADLVRNFDVLVSATPPIVLAVRQASTTVPFVVLAPGDPVESGLVKSLARPGGNITGISRLVRELSGKRLELMKESIPRLSRIAVLWDPEEKPSAAGYRDYAAAASSLKLELLSREIRRSNPGLEAAFEAAVKARAGALVVVRNTQMLGHAKRIAELAITHRLPTMFEGTEFVDAGGLMSYSPDDIASFKRTAVFVDKILKGAKPGDLPMEQPTKFELVVNMKTAKALRLAISQDFLLRADRVIE